MNKKSAYYSGIFMLLVYLKLTTGSLFAADAKSMHPEHSDDNMVTKISNLGSSIEFKYTPEVKEYIKRYTKPGKSGSEQILGRIPVYFPVFEDKLKEKNLPEELKVLAIVESHLNVGAYSKAGAAGLWQLIKGTARQYNLTVKRNFDERFAVEESTEAALNFLNDLYGQFDDWTLALAAYNCGPGNVRKAIKRSGGKRDFWKIMRYLPKETRNYVPKFIAISYLLKHYKEYGIQPEIPDKRYFETADATVYRHLTFRQISDLTGLPMDVIKKMNYAYRKNYIPASTRGYKLTLPKQALFTLLDFDDSGRIEFEKEHNYDFSKYVIDNFPREVAMQLLGNKYRLDIDMLKIRIPRLIFNDKNRVIVFKNNFAGINRYKMSRFNPSFVYHELKPGESLIAVADQFDVSLEDVMRWNDIHITSPPLQGTILKIKR